MERIFQSTPNRVLMTHTVLLPGIQLRHFNTTCAVYVEGLQVLHGGCPVVVAQWQSTDCTGQVFWVQFPPTARLSLSPQRHLKSLFKNIYIHVYLQHHLSVSAMAVFAWLAEQAVMKEEWRCVSMGCGGLWPTFYGTPERPQWCANSLDTRIQVNEMVVTQHCLSEILVARNLYHLI